jgi:hypothetical protein
MCAEDVACQALDILLDGDVDDVSADRAARGAHFGVNSFGTFRFELSHFD